MKRPYFFVDGDNVYYKMLAEAVIDELQELCPEVKSRYVSSIKDVIKADPLIICGDGYLPKGLLHLISILRKKVVLYHTVRESEIFDSLAKRARWTVGSENIEGYSYYPSPVLLSDTATQRNIDRVWKRERLVSKRGCIGIIGLGIAEEAKRNLLNALNLLIEDLDLNVIFISMSGKDREKDIMPGIRYSANTRYIDGKKYTTNELLGIIGRIDILIAPDEKGVICSMAVNRPVIGLAGDNKLKYLLGNITQEEVVLDAGKITGDELYSKLKIAWVHRMSITEQIQNCIKVLKGQAEEGIRKLCKEFIE